MPEHPPTTHRLPELAGRVFLGQYQIAHLLGEGAMGRVYLARRRGDGGRVVVKVMHDHVANEPHFREMFEREMQFMSRFQHPHVVALYDASLKDPNGPCIVMEYVPGSDLESLLEKHRRFPAARVGRLLGQLCSALQTAHNNGIIHRDLKPANLMIVDADTPTETVKVMDFGLAKLSARPHIRLEKLKGDNRDFATGTPEYMASEQARGDEVDHRADLYSVGVILYELLTGRLPFNRKTVPEILQAHVEDPPPPFAAIGAAGIVPPAIEKVVMWCLSKYPIERPQSAWELAQRYEDALGQKVLAGITPPGAAIAPEHMPQTAPAAAKKVHDPGATVHELEAWMPESIATIKIRGFVEDVGGEVTGSEPGLIRVQLGGPRCKYKVGEPAAPVKRGWFSSAPAPKPNLIDLELHMEKQGGKGNLHITLVLRPAKGSAVRKTSPDWKNCCDAIYRDIKAYLMSK